MGRQVPRVARVGEVIAPLTFDPPSRARALSRAGLLETVTARGFTVTRPHRSRGAQALHATPHDGDGSRSAHGPLIHEHPEPEAPRLESRCRADAAVIDTDHDNDTGAAEPWSLQARDCTDAAVIDTARPELSRLQARGRPATVNVARTLGVLPARTTRTREGV